MALLTVKELQDVLRVDRVTIYRMLESGELPGFKVGGQWRFEQEAIRAWLEGQRAGLAEQAGGPFLPAQAQASSHPLPLTCVDPIQDIFAEAMGVTAFTADLHGRPLTPLRNACEYCCRVQSTEKGRQMCQDSWNRLVWGRSGLQSAQCHAGLQIRAVAVELEGERVAWTVAGGFSISDAGLVERELLATLGSTLGLDGEALGSLLSSIPQLSPQEAGRVEVLLGKVAGTIAEMGEQRVQLLGRLQRIADIASQIS